MDIFSATLADLNALRQVEKTCFPKDAWPLLDLIAVLTFPGVVRLKAVWQGRMVGFIAGDPRPREDLSWIATLGVLPEHRGKGLARALLEACEAQLPTQHIRLCARASNEEAIRLYSHAGYQLVDHWIAYYSDGEDAIVLEKTRSYARDHSTRPTLHQHR